MAYYNNKLALWEHLIEPIEHIKAGRATYLPWEIKLDVTMNEQEDQSIPTSTPSSPSTEVIEQVEAQMQSTMKINVTSTKNLELTVTKTCLEVLNNLGKAFSNAMKSTEVKPIRVYAAYVVRNETGIPIKLCIEKSSFFLLDDEETKEVILETGASVALALKNEAATHGLAIREDATKTALGGNEHVLHVNVEQANCELSLAVVNAVKRYYLLNYRAFKKDNWGIVSTIKVDDGVKIITLHSIVQVLCLFLYRILFLKEIFRYTITLISPLKYIT